MSRRVSLPAPLPLAATTRLLLGGGFGALHEFLGRAESGAVRATHRLSDGRVCPVAPVCELPVSVRVDPGDHLELRDLEGAPIAEVAVTSVEAASASTLQVAGPVRTPDRGLERVQSTPLIARFPAGAIALASYRTDPQAVAAARPSGVLYPVPPHELDDPRPARRIAAWREAFGSRLTVLTTPWAGPAANEVAHRALVASTSGALGLLVPPVALGLVAELFPQLPAKAACELASTCNPPAKQGVTFFFTGLSGAGKSTLARALAQRLGSLGVTVTLLDGDLVRAHLSDRLGFSREDRDANIRRIAYVAAEITKHGGVAICAPIAPYASARHEARELVERYGRFVLVYVSTPLHVCEQRDAKGLYAKARTGELPAFTGISDPYEAPAHAEVSVDTSSESVEDALRRLLRYVETSETRTPG